MGEWSLATTVDEQVARHLEASARERGVTLDEQVGLALTEWYQLTRPFTGRATGKLCLRCEQFHGGATQVFTTDEALEQHEWRVHLAEPGFIRDDGTGQLVCEPCHRAVTTTRAPDRIAAIAMHLAHQHGWPV